jgi:hypothetical protein
VHQSDVDMFCCSFEDIKDMALALLYPWEMEDSAAVAQRALVHGLTAAIRTVLRMLPPKQTGSTMPTTAQVLQDPHAWLPSYSTKDSSPVLVWVTAAGLWPDCHEKFVNPVCRSCACSDR